LDRHLTREIAGPGLDVPDKEVTTKHTKHTKKEVKKIRS
jgi:hypothetical protein